MSNSTDNKTNKNNMNICYIVGAGDLHEAKFEFTNRGLLIAADGGYKVLKHAKIAPDFVVGDFDSLKIFPKEVPTEVYSKDKDETDMMIAVNKGFDLGHNIFVIYGGLGGRFEHSMANIQLLTYIAKKEGRGYLIQGDKIITVLSNDSLLINAQDDGYVSVLSLSETANGVTLKGLKYPLNEAKLSNSYPMGVSNEFIGEEVSIEVKDGILMVLWSSKNPEHSLFTYSS